jgi:hypothetical protein
MPRGTGGVVAVRRFRRGSNENEALRVIAALAMGVSFPVLADDKPPGKSQPLYSPRLADIMVATQLRHFKLLVCGPSEELAVSKL